MPKPKPLPPDTRPDWRDPNMPVNWRVWDSNRHRIIDVYAPPEVRVQNSRQTLMRNAPHWSNDPTYHLRAKRAKGND